MLEHAPAAKRPMTKSYEQTCPFARTLDLIGDRWTVLILRDLCLGFTRFSEFRAQSPGMPTKILSDRLRSLEEYGFVARSIYSEHPLRAEYRLTPLGKTLEPVLAAIFAWGMQHTLSSKERTLLRRRLRELDAAGRVTEIAGFKL